MMVAAAVVMVSPESFGPNAETAASNAFQRPDARADDPVHARAEWRALRDRLRAAGVRVHEFGGSRAPNRPDQCFPNNWFSTHPDGSLVLYPMMAANRRAERRTDIIQMLGQTYQVKRILDLSAAEARGQFLEGTGSVVIDHRYGVGFAALSPRTDAGLAARLGRELGLTMLTFTSRDAHGQPFYHSNVLMSVAEHFALWCPQALPDASERRAVADHLGQGGRPVIELSLPQTRCFAANLIALSGDQGPVIALSEAALAALNADQRARLADAGQLVSVAVPTLERIGGGSVRCLLAEVHLPVRR